MGATFLEKNKLEGSESYNYATIVLTALAGVVFYKNYGLPQRFPKEIQFLFNVKKGDPPEWRTKSCFLLDGQKFSDYSTECNEASTLLKKKKILLWGDSHAAHLYPVLKVWAKKNNFAVAQYTYSGCPPIIDFDSKVRPDCYENNELILDKLSEVKPDIIILALFWSYYTDEKEEIVIFNKLQKTIETIKSKSAAKIFLVGQVPLWQGELALILLET